MGMLTGRSSNHMSAESIWEVVPTRPGCCYLRNIVVNQYLALHKKEIGFTLKQLQKAELKIL